MSDKKQLYYAKDLKEIFYYLKTVSGLEIISGCTQNISLPEKSLCIRNVSELRFITKHERRFDLGPEVTLSEILDIDPEKLPSVFLEAIKSVANSNIRNIATLAGNICSKNYRHTLFAPLLAMDAKLEIMKENETKIIFISEIDNIPYGWIISKILLPLENWEVAVFRRLGPGHLITKNSASFVFLANSIKRQIANLKITFAGPFYFCSRELENNIIGAHLPLDESLITKVLHEASMEFDELKGDIETPPILKDQFINLLKNSLEQLT